MVDTVDAVNTYQVPGCTSISQEHLGKPHIDHQQCIMNRNIIPSSYEVEYFVELPTWKICVGTQIARITACVLVKDICRPLSFEQYSLNKDQQSDVNKFVHGDR